MSKRINITINDGLYLTLQRHKDSMNISKVCADAIANEIKRLIILENKLKPKLDNLLNDFSKDDIINTLKQRTIL